MNTITKQQLYTRWDALPDILREAIASDVNSQLVWRTSENEHLSKEKIAAVSKLTGYVLMGFMHPEDLAGEITSATGIDKRVSLSITDKINTKIFRPLADELEQIYAPATDDEKVPAGPAPVSMDSISSFNAAQDKSPRAEEAGKPQATAPAPAPTDRIPKPITPPAPVTAPKPAIKAGALPQSMIRPKQPVKAAPPPNLPVLSGVETSISDELPIIKPAGKIAPLTQKEFEIQPGSTPKDSSGQAGSLQAAAAPFILHQETEFQPLAPTKSNFKVSLSEEQFGKMEQKWTAPPKAAQIETAFVPQSKPADSPAPSKVEARIVHYNEMKTPVAPKPPMANQPTIPKPPTPPSSSIGFTPGYKTGQPMQPRFPVSQAEQKMARQPTNPFGVSDRNGGQANHSDFKQ